MRTLSADWMANTSKPESELQPLQHGSEESKGNFFYPRPVAPTAAQVYFIKIAVLFMCARHSFRIIVIITVLVLL